MGLCASMGLYGFWADVPSQRYNRSGFDLCLPRRHRHELLINGRVYWFVDHYLFWDTQPLGSGPRLGYADGWEVVD